MKKKKYSWLAGILLFAGCVIGILNQGKYAVDWLRYSFVGFLGFLLVIGGIVVWVAINVEGGT